MNRNERIQSNLKAKDVIKADESETVEQIQILMASLSPKTKQLLAIQLLQQVNAEVLQ